MVVKECNSRAGVYKVQTFGTTQPGGDVRKNGAENRSRSIEHIVRWINKARF